MRLTAGVVLATAAVLSTSNSTAVAYEGGRSLFMVSGTITSITLQVQDPTGAWLNVGSAITSVGTVALDCPKGQYRVTGTGTVSNASLMPVPYA